MYRPREAFYSLSRCAGSGFGAVSSPRWGFSFKFDYHIAIRAGPKVILYDTRIGLGPETSFLEHLNWSVNWIAMPESERDKPPSGIPPTPLIRANWERGGWKERPSRFGISEDGVIECDLKCRSCGYNLRGLCRAGVCPECGAAVERSLCSDLIRFSGLHLIRRMLHGVRLAHGVVLWSLVTILAAGILIAFGAVFEMSSGQTPILGEIFLVIGEISGVLIAIGFPAAYPLGWWWATTPDPIDDASMKRWRTILRWTAIGFVFCHPLYLGVRYFGLSIGGSAPAIIVETVTHLIFAAIWLHLLSMNHYYNSILQRCAGMSPTKREESRRRSVARNLKWVRIFPAVLFGFHWIAVCLTLLRGGQSGMAGWGIGYGAGVGLFWITMLWFVTIGLAGYLTEPLRGELLLAIGMSEYENVEEFENTSERGKGWRGWRGFFSLEGTD